MINTLGFKCKTKIYMQCNTLMKKTQEIDHLFSPYLYIQCKTLRFNWKFIVCMQCNTWLKYFLNP